MKENEEIRMVYGRTSDTGLMSLIRNVPDGAGFFFFVTSPQS